PAGADGDVLHAVEHVGHRTSDYAAIDRYLPELLSLVGAVGAEAHVGRALEDQVAGRRERTAVPEVIVLNPPSGLLLHGIPREQVASARVLAIQRAELVQVDR